MLWLGSIFCYVAFLLQTDYSDKSNAWLGVVLDFLVIVTSLFSYAQQAKSADMMAQFENFIPPVAEVFRDGRSI